MKFSCQNSGKCCSHPNIVVTLTHEDIYRLMNNINDFSILISRTQFMVNPEEQKDNLIESKTVIKDLKTNSGNGHFILRRVGLNECTFYDSTNKNCTIHNYRPLACRNFPFSFNSIGKEQQLVATWVNSAKGFCPGIGSGTEYTTENLESIGKKTITLFSDYNILVDEINKESDLNKPLTPQEALMTILLVGEKNRANFQEVKEIL